MTALCLVNQTCKLLPEMSTFNLMAFIAFMFEAFDKISDAIAPPRTGYIKCTFKGCFMRIHAAKHNTEGGAERAIGLKFQCFELPARSYAIS
jgi:hypothetical protein